MSRRRSGSWASRISARRAGRRVFRSSGSANGNGRGPSCTPSGAGLLKRRRQASACSRAGRRLCQRPARATRTTTACPEPERAVRLPSRGRAALAQDASASQPAHASDLGRGCGASETCGCLSSTSPIPDLTVALTSASREKPSAVVPLALIRAGALVDRCPDREHKRRDVMPTTRRRFTSSERRRLAAGARQLRAPARDARVAGSKEGVSAAR